MDILNVEATFLRDSYLLGGGLRVGMQRRARDICFLRSVQRGEDVMVRWSWLGWVVAAAFVTSTLGDFSAY